MTVLVEAALDQLGTGLPATDAAGAVVAANRAALGLLAGDAPVGRPVRAVLGEMFSAPLSAPASGRWSPRPGQAVERQWAVPLPQTPDGGRCLVLRDVSHRLADRARRRRQNRALAELAVMQLAVMQLVGMQLVGMQLVGMQLVGCSSSRWCRTGCARR